MDDFEKGEFWNALGRLYDASVALRTATENLYQVAQLHEKRLDKAEVQIQAILEDLRRRRNDQ